MIRNFRWDCLKMRWALSKQPTWRNLRPPTFFNVESLWSTICHFWASIPEAWYFSNSSVPATLNSQIIFAILENVLPVLHNWLSFLFRVLLKSELIINTFVTEALFSFPQKTSTIAPRKDDTRSIRSKWDISNIPIMLCLPKRPDKLCVLSAFEKSVWRSNPGDCLKTSLSYFFISEWTIVSICVNFLGSSFDFTQVNRQFLVIAQHICEIFHLHYTDAKR